MSAEILAFLNQAVRRIGASVDTGQTARLFCEAVVPRIADAAAVYLGGLDGGAYSRHAGLDPHGRLPDEWCEHGLSEPAVLECGRLAVPLRAYGKPVGYAVLAREPGRAPFAEADLLVADQLGMSTALSIYHGRQLETVEALQRGMVPNAPPRLPGVEIAYRYRPSGARVGGDWFDVIPLPGSRVALVVGDVMGHGLDAAAVMGQLRTAVQTLASLDLPAEQVLHALDEMAQRLAAQTLTTCVYCVYDPVLRRCTVASAGHLPPIMADGRGEAWLLRPPRCPPIGLGRTTFETVEVTAEDDSLLVLYTDGLVERRGEDLCQGVEELRRRVADGPRPVEELCDRLLAQAPAQSDDVTLLAIRFRGIPSGDVANWFLEPMTQTPSRVRRLIRRALTEWDLSAMVPLTELLASELVTNAVRYASKPIAVRLVRTDALLCEVRDDDVHIPVLREPDAERENGWGIFLVSQLADNWGVSRLAGGKTVWFSLRIR